MIKASKLVEHILSQSREARNSDKVLIIKVMAFYGIYLDEAQQARFKKMPSTETFRRIRQKIQESGKYPADQEVGKERRYKGYRMQQYGKDLKPDTIERIILPWKEGE